MTLRITYKHGQMIDDYMDNFETIAEALAYMQQVNASNGAEIILDIRPMND